MKRTKLFGICTSIFVVLSGCMGMKSTTKAPIIEDVTVPRLQITQPVALRNTAPNSGAKMISDTGSFFVYADLHQYTKSSISAAKKILEAQNVEVRDDAEKVMELSIYKATSTIARWAFNATTYLRVKTGNGLLKEYTATQRHRNGFGTTSAMEKTLARGLEQMFSDKDILKYLRD